MVLKKPKIGTGNAEAASPRGRIFQARQGIGKAFDNKLELYFQAFQTGF